eukprot:1060329-Pyramimonas_sp.AAC.1
MSPQDWRAEAAPGCSAIICSVCSARAASFSALSSSSRARSRSARSASMLWPCDGAAAEAELPGSG